MDNELTHKAEDSVDLILATDELNNEKMTLEELNRNGETLWRKGDYQEALTYFEQAYQRSEGFKKDKADALHGIGLVHDSLGNLEEAAKKYQESLLIRQEIDDKKGIAMSLHDLATISKEIGKLDKALEIFNLSLDTSREIDDKESIACVLGQISAVFFEKGNLSDALKTHQESMAIRQEIGDKEGIATALNNLGTFFSEKGNLTEALKHYQESLSIRREIDDKEGIASCLRNIGILHTNQKNYVIAMPYFVEAFALQNQINLTLEAKHTESYILTVRQIIGLKKLKALLQTVHAELSEELKPYVDINIFVQDTTIQKAAATPKPNEPCSCGSGKKYKKCCGNR
jgi:tetratricopeptide (TPR) repeat protein